MDKVKNIHVCLWLCFFLKISNLILKMVLIFGKETGSYKFLERQQLALKSGEWAFLPQNV